MTRGQLLFLSAASAAIGACSDEQHSGANGDPSDVATMLDANTADGSHDALHGSRDALEAGSERDVDERPPMLRRGEYLVKHVAICGDCHTARAADGTPNQAKFLAGTPGMFHASGVGFDGGDGIVSPRNLTPDMDTGLGSWTDAEIERAFREGIAKNGKALFPIMPYYVFHNMSDEDADAIVAYLRSVPAVRNVVPERNFDVAVPALPIAAAMIPDPTLEPMHPDYASAMRGKYLAASVGACMDCHTDHVIGPVPLDVDNLFSGGRSFASADFGIPSPPFPPVIQSANITPHPNGLEGWTATAVAALLREGIDADGVRICPPMPVGPMGSFGGLTDKDAKDIGNYIVYLPPKANAVPSACRDKMRGDDNTAGARASD